MQRYKKSGLPSENGSYVLYSDHVLEQADLMAKIYKMRVMIQAANKIEKSRDIHIIDACCKSAGLSII